MKKIVAIALTLIMCLTMSVPALASENEAAPTITEEEVLAAIENGTATITTEVRDVSSYTAEEISADAGLQELFANMPNPNARTAHQFRAVGQVYTTTIATDGATVVYRLSPRADLLVADVATASSADISSKLFVSESVTVNGVVKDTWKNHIKLKNISCTMGCGANTIFTSQIEAKGLIDGESQADGNDALYALMGIAASAAGYTTLAMIIEGFSAISYSGSYVDETSITSTNARAVGLRWKSAAVIDEEEDYLLAESSLSTKNSAETANVVTYAVGEWKFDVYYGVNKEYSSISLKPNGTYLVNVK